MRTSDLARAALRLFAALALAACGPDGGATDDALSLPTLDIARPAPDLATPPPILDEAPPYSPDLADAGDGWTLAWSDEFSGADGASPDPGKWSFELGAGGWGNGELEDYTARTSNAVVQGGHLVITARKENYQGSAWTSARMKTAGKFAFTYGRVEMSATLPAGQGLWPAFWMLGANIDQGVGWPGCGEIDIMEFVGKTPTKIYGTIHGPGYSGGNGVGAWYEDGGGFAGAFHRYAVEWEPGVVRWYYDDHLYEERTPIDIGAGHTWVYDHDFFVLLNLAIGGNFPGAPDNTTPAASSYVIDYVRVYRRSGALPPPPTRAVVSLKSRGNGKFLSVDKNTNGLSASRDVASTWEFFDQVPSPFGDVALWALSNDKYLTGSAPVQASAEAITAGETFTRVANNDGSTSLRGVASGKYLSVGNGGAVTAGASSITPAEEFDVASQ